MALALMLWPTMTAAQRLADCYNLTTTPPLSGVPGPVAVTFTQRCGLYQRGERAAFPPEEAAALLAAGFAA